MTAAVPTADVACAAATAAPPVDCTATSPIPPAAAAAIDRANDDWVRAIRTGDADALSRPYAADGVFVMPDGRTVRGRDAIRAMYAARSTATRLVDVQLRSLGRVLAGPHDVYEWGDATMVVEGADGVRTTRSGRYLTAWHREPDGTWSIARNIAF